MERLVWVIYLFFPQSTVLLHALKKKPIWHLENTKSMHFPYTFEFKKMKCQKNKNKKNKK